MTAMKVVPTEKMIEAGWRAFHESDKPAPYNQFADGLRAAMLSAVEPAPDGLVDADIDQIIRDVKNEYFEDCERSGCHPSKGEAIDAIAFGAVRDALALTSRAAVLEEAAKICEVEARAYRKMKTNSVGERTEDVDECEELAYCCDLNAKAIRAAKGE